MATPLYDDLKTYISDELTMELPGFSSTTDASTIRRLFQRCIRQGYRSTRALETYWDNVAVTGTLSLSGYTVTLPDDCLEPTRVEWDGSANELEWTSQAYLDEYEAGWRDQTGDPDKCYRSGSSIILNSTPTGTTAGKLVVRGFGSPTMTTDDNCESVLAALPEDVQDAPAIYILAYWRVTPTNEASKFRYQRYMAEWSLTTPGQASARDRLLSAIAARKYEPFTYL